MIHRVKSLIDPRFVFRPDVLFKAIYRRLRAFPDVTVVSAAWGDRFQIDPSQFIGRQLYMRAAHELVICEALWRLAVPGEIAVDIGANMGVMSSVLSRKLGADGRVYAFEAHPDLAQRMALNVALWNRGNVQIRQCAVSSRVGVVDLRETADCNEGVAQVLLDAPQSAEGMKIIQVAATTLDHELGGMKSGVWKIDVEGHEEDVLLGAAGLLKSHGVRDIVFEGSSEFPSAVHHLLRAHGYTTFRLTETLLGPKIEDPGQAMRKPWPLCDYVATLDVNRLARSMRSRGWRILSCV